MKKISYIALFFFVLASCKHDYSYVEISQHGAATTEEKTIIAAQNDSVAYVEALKKFSVSLSVEGAMRTNASDMSGVVGFLLLNDDGKLIQRPFKNKSKYNIEHDLNSAFLALKPDSIARLKMKRFREAQLNSMN